MDIEKQLPYIGTEVNGVLEFEPDFPIKFRLRPDYKELKKTLYSDEQSLVDALIGLERSSSVYRIADEKMASDIETGKEPCNICMELNSLLLKIQEIIEIGAATGEIGNVLESGKKNPDDPPTILNKMFFKIYRYYHTLSFLDWMQRNGFPIPNELAIDRDAAGNLVWRESIPRGVDLNALSEIKKVETAKNLKKQGKFAGEIIGLLWIDYEKFDKNQKAALADLLKRKCDFTNAEIVRVLYPGETEKSAITKKNRHVRALKEKVKKCSGDDR